MNNFSNHRDLAGSLGIPIIRVFHFCAYWLVGKSYMKRYYSLKHILHDVLNWNHVQRRLEDSSCSLISIALEWGYHSNTLGEVLNWLKRDKDTLWNRSNVCLNWNPKMNGRIMWQMRQQDKQLVLEQRKHNTWRWVQLVSSVSIWPCHPKAKELWHPLWEARDITCSWNTQERVMRLTRSHKIWESSKKTTQIPPSTVIV